MNRKNLEKLAAYLLTLPVNYRHFSMIDYFIIDGYDGLPTDAAGEIGWGSVACAVGHGPAAGVRAKDGETWSQYENRVFGLSSKEWDWCFHNEWVYTDDTPHGAARRILHMLEFGVPDNALAQMRGTEPYILIDREEAQRQHIIDHGGGS